MTTTKEPDMKHYASTHRVTNLDDLTKGMLIAHPLEPTETITVHAVEPTADKNPRRALLIFTRGSRGLHQVAVDRVARFDQRIEVTVGLGATIPMVTDSSAAVVTRVTAHTLTVMRVETGAPVKAPGFGTGAFGLSVMDRPGVLDRTIPGTERRFTRKIGLRGQISYWNGQTRLVLGSSFSRRDWRD